jgi:lipopolysaccharide export system protein LptA
VTGAEGRVGGAETGMHGMKRLAAGLTLAACLWAPHAWAQLAPGNGPIDMSADELELVDANHTAIWKGAVDAIQGDNRMRADQVTLIFSGKASAGGNASAGAPGKNWGDVQRMQAEGNVFFVSPQQRARGDHAIYELSSGNLVMTGGVIVAQGDSVVKGDKLIIEVKTGHATMVSAAQGRGAPGRVRGVFYPDQSKKKSQ